MLVDKLVGRLISPTGLFGSRGIAKQATVTASSQEIADKAKHDEIF
jgi:hypothetical protein